MARLIFGAGLRQTGDVVDLQVAGEEDEIGGVKVPARGPGQGLALGADGLLRAPLATDQHAGAITEPTITGRQHGRVRDNTTGISAWQEIPPGIGDAPVDSNVYGRTRGRWIALQHDGSFPPAALLYVQLSGDTMAGPLLLHANASEPMQAVTYQQLDALKLYVDGKDSALDILARQGVEEAPNDGNPYVRMFRQWEPLPPPVTYETGLTLNGAEVHVIPATDGAIGGVFVPDRMGLALLANGQLSLAPTTPSQVGGIVDAPYDSKSYLRRDAQWVENTATGGLVPIGRSPINGLAHGYDDLLKAETIFVPLATDKLAGAMVEPGPDGLPYARTHDGMAGQWVPIAAAGVAVSDGPPDPAVANTLWWESDTGNLFLNYQDVDSTAWVQINTTSTPGLEEAPTDGQAYVRQSSAWAVAAAGGGAPPAGDYLPLDGSLPMTGALKVAKADDVTGTFSVLSATNASGDMRFDLRCIADEDYNFGRVELWVQMATMGEKLIFRSDDSTSPGVEFGGGVSTPSSIIAGGNVWLNKAEPTYQQSFYFSAAGTDYFRISFDNPDLWSFDRYPDGSNTASFFFQCDRLTGVVDFAQAPTRAGEALVSLSELTAANDRIARLEERLARIEGRAG